MRRPLETSAPPRAAALAYTAADTGVGGAPRVVAKGQWWLADEIIRRAREAGVAVHESRELVALLMRVDLDEQIPPALYVAVAEVLAWVYKLEHRDAPIAPGAQPQSLTHSPWA